MPAASFWPMDPQLLDDVVPNDVAPTLLQNTLSSPDPSSSSSGREKATVQVESTLWMLYKHLCLRAFMFWSPREATSEFSRQNHPGGTRHSRLPSLHPSLIHSALTCSRACVITSCRSGCLRETRVHRRPPPGRLRRTAACPCSGAG